MIPRVSASVETKTEVVRRFLGGAGAGDLSIQFGCRRESIEAILRDAFQQTVALVAKQARDVTSTVDADAPVDA